MNATQQGRPVALVTGAADGIGKAIVARLLVAGFRVAAMDKNPQSSTSDRDAVTDDRVFAIAGDAADADAMVGAVGGALDRYGRIDAAVFNAGIAGTSAPLKNYPIEVFDEVMRVNVHGPWHGIQAVAPAMRARGIGSIVIISSINGMRGFGTFAAYAASKQAVMGLTRTAAIDLATHGIRVNSVHPGLVDTAMMRRVEEQVGAPSTRAARAQFTALVPLGRYAEPGEIANVVVFLAGDESTYVTGAAYVVDGGFTAGMPASQPRDQ